MARITHARFTFSPFSAEQMHELGNAVLASVKERIHKGITVDESPAKPLKGVTHIDRSGSTASLIPYAEQKARKGRQAIRDLMNTGALMNSIVVVSASEDRCVIASNNPVKDAVLHKNQVRSPEFGMSATDKAVMQKKVRELLQASFRVVSG